MTLLGAGLGCWRSTARQGIADVRAHSNAIRGIPLNDCGFETPVCVAPLLVANDELSGFKVRRCYYFWFYGVVAKLPYERPLYKIHDHVLIGDEQVMSMDGDK